MFKKLENKLFNIDKRLDDKICVFHEELKKSMEAEINRTSKNLDNKVGSLKQVFNNLKGTVETRMEHKEEYTASDSIMELETKIENVQKEVSKIDFLRNFEQHTVTI